MTLKFSMESTTSYNSIHPAYTYVEQFGNNNETYRERTKWFGVLLAFISGTFFTISSSLVKAIRGVNPMVLLAIRSVVQIVAMMIVGGWTSTNLLGPKDQRALIHLQGIVGGTTLALLYFSFRLLPIGDATTIIFSSPVLVILLSFLFLREPCGVLRVAVICALFTGVALVTKPPFIFEIDQETPHNMVGYACAFLATLFTALNIVVMRKCCGVHFSVVVLNLSCWSLLTSTIFYFVVPEFHEHGTHHHFHFNWQLPKIPDDPVTWVLIFMVAFTGLTGQVLVAKALQIEGAGKVSVTRSLDIILAYVVQIYFFGDVPSPSSAFGAFLILLSVIIMGFEKEIYGFCDFVP